MKTRFLDHIIHRLFTPPVIAILVYLLVLLIFDRLSEIANNFSPEEIILLILICYSLFETYRILLRFSENNKWLSGKKQIRHGFQIIGNILISLSIVSLGFWLYFKFYLHLTDYDRELSTFLIVFTSIGLFFYLFYLSIYFLDQQNSLRLKKEAINRQNIEFEMEVFKNRINPDFLFLSLEGIIQLIRNKEIEKAEEHIDYLALFYRKILNNRFHELNSIKEEVIKVEKYLKLQNHSLGTQIVFSIKETELNHQTVPNVLLQGVQLIQASQLIPHNKEYKIKAKIEEQVLELEFENNPRIKPEVEHEKWLENMRRAVHYYNNTPITWDLSPAKGILTIPLIALHN
ncbi:MAG: histidine kinase [Marinifilaceae bacterium]